VADGRTVSDLAHGRTVDGMAHGRPVDGMAHGRPVGDLVHGRPVGGLAGRAHRAGLRLTLDLEPPAICVLATSGGVTYT
jgi:hypothetical protein